MCVALTSLSLLMRRLAVAAFGLWLCGAGCALCCVPSGSDAHAQTLAATLANAAPSDDARALAAAHCPAHARASHSEAGGYVLVSASTRKPSPTGDHADTCCDRTRQTSDAARKQHPASERAAPARGEFSWTDDAAREVSRPAARGRSPDGRATHVRYCVFLI